MNYRNKYLKYLKKYQSSIGGMVAEYIPARDDRDLERFADQILQDRNVILTPTQAFSLPEHLKKTICRRCNAPRMGTRDRLVREILVLSRLE